MLFSTIKVPAKASHKPNSVPLIGFPHRVDDHSSKDAGCPERLLRPTRKLGRAARFASLFGLAPGGVYPAFPVTWKTGALLPHRFTLTGFGQAPKPGGLLSVALACASPRLSVREHPALWCSDFPLAAVCGQRSSGRL